MEKESLLIKIKNFFKKLFQKNNQKLLTTENTKVNNAENIQINSIDNTKINSNSNEENEKNRILELYDKVKLGEINILDISKDDLNKLVVLSNEEIKLLEQKYDESLLELKKVI